MNAAVLLTRLYPPAVRERWGEDISHEVSAAGIRSWPDTDKTRVLYLFSSSAAPNN
ncbi:hypothetical protein ACWC2T_33560 [Streptomyces sp. NPDC001393]